MSFEKMGSESGEGPKVTRRNFLGMIAGGALAAAIPEGSAEAGTIREQYIEAAQNLQPHTEFFLNTAKVMGETYYGDAGIPEASILPELIEAMQLEQEKLQGIVNGDTNYFEVRNVPETLLFFAKIMHGYMHALPEDSQYKTDFESRRSEVTEILESFR